MDFICFLCYYNIAWLYFAVFFSEKEGARWMSNEILATIYCAMFVVTAVMAFSTANKDLHLPGNRAFFVFCCLMAGCLLCELLFVLSQDSLLCRILFDTKLVFVSFAASQLLIVSIHLFRKSAQLTKTWHFFLLYIIPAITSILAATSQFHPLLRKELVVIPAAPAHVVRVTQGVWFWVHTAYCYAIIIVTGVLVLLQLRQAAKGRRWLLYLMTLSIIAAILGNAAVVFGIVGNGPDLTLLGFASSVFVGYAAVHVWDITSFLVLSRDRIFHHMEDGMFVLDLQNNIVDYNSAAKELLEKAGVTAQVNRFFQVTQSLSPAVDVDINAAKGPLGEDIEINNECCAVIYNLKLRDICNARNKPVGMFASFNEVTHYRTLIDKLELSAESDTLTGLGNHRAYERRLEELDTDENLPFSVVVGDVNLLKNVNDLYGHTVGDKLLQLIAYALRDFCPAGGLPHRVGGDEFIVLLPDTSFAETQEYVNNILLALSRVKSFPCKPSLAMGYATKVSSEENFVYLIQQADSMMYTHKSKTWSIPPGVLP